jgi:FixJ family two-component response regulator
MSTPTVHIVDDDLNLCRELGRLLRSHDYSVECHSSAAQFLCRQQLFAPACLVLDLKNPAIDSLDLQAMLSRHDSYIPIVFISGCTDVDTIVRAMKAGAVDFLTKPLNEERLLLAVHSALILSEEALIRRNKMRRDKAAFISLTRREQEVCLRVAQGLLNKQVGYELGTSEKTVKSQRARMMQKLGANSLPEIVLLVERLRSAGALPAVTAPQPPARMPAPVADRLRSRISATLPLAMPRSESQPAA